MVSDAWVGICALSKGWCGLIGRGDRSRQLFVALIFFRRCSAQEASFPGFDGSSWNGDEFPG